MEGNNNGPSGGPNSGGNPTPQNRSEYARQVRESMNERRRQVNQTLNQFRPHVHDQMNRLFSGYQAPLYARIRGFSTANTLALTEYSIVALSAGSKRHFADQETQALAEHIITGLNRNIMCKWALTCFAGYMTYRGRKTFRFPFVKPTGGILGGQFDPFHGSRAVKMSWHAARFTAYNIFAWLAFEPILQVANMTNQKSAMMADPRLQNITAFSGEDHHPAQGQEQEAGSSWGQEAQQGYTQQQQVSRDQSYAEASSSYSQQSQTQEQSLWAGYNQPASPQSQQQQPKDTWGSQAADDFDDASPVASPSQSNASYSGSAWDRVRQQSQQPQRRQQPRYQQQQQQQQSNEWGNVDDDASPQRRPASESYTYSAADEERATAKTQAQREFDALVERERYGEDQGRSSWGRK